MAEQSDKQPVEPLKKVSNKKDQLKRAKSYKSKKQQICTFFNTAKGCGSGDKCPNKHIKYNDAICTFFNTKKGCGSGDKCKFKHIKYNDVICIFFNTAKGCIKSDKCKYKHVRDAQKEKSEINPYLDTKLITNINDEIQKTKPPKVSTDNQTEKALKDKLKRTKSSKSKKQQICTSFNKKKGCDYGDKCKYQHIKYNDVICTFFNTKKGCLNGDKCKYKHISDNKNKNQESLQTAEQQNNDDNKSEEIRICTFFNQPNGCFKGDKCTFKHVDMNQEISKNDKIKSTKPDKPQEQSLPDKSPKSPKSSKSPKTPKSPKSPKSSKSSKSPKTPKMPKSPKTPLKKDKIKRTKSDKPHASKPNLSAKDKAEKKEQSPTSYPSEKHDLPKKAQMVEDLRVLSNTWYQNNDVNVENLGLYLKAVLDGYEANMDTDLNHGYVKYGTYARTFCEVVCNYMLGKKSLKLMLHAKCKLMEKEEIIYPTDSMNFVRKNTNKIVHGVQFGEAAKKRYISWQNQQEILKNIYIIAKWVKIKNSKKDLNEVRVD